MEVVSFSSQGFCRNSMKFMEILCPSRHVSSSMALVSGDIVIPAYDELHLITQAWLDLDPFVVAGRWGLGRS